MDAIAGRQVFRSADEIEFEDDFAVGSDGGYVMDDEGNLLMNIPDKYVNPNNFQGLSLQPARCAV